MSQVFYKFLPPVKIENENRKKEYFFWYLKTEMLRFTQPTQLNDPWECRPYRFEESHPDLSSMQQGFAKEMETLTVRKRIIKDLDNQFGILSLTSAIHSSAMWAHYAMDHSGICIGFNKNHEFFRSPDVGMIKPEPVRYRAKPVEYEFRVAGPEPEILYTKALEWAYEEEWRMVVEFSKKSPAGIIPFHNKPWVKLYRLPFDAIKSIILGSRMEPRCKLKVRNWADERGIDVYVSIPDAERFEMDTHLLPRTKIDMSGLVP